MKLPPFVPSVPRSTSDSSHEAPPVTSEAVAPSAGKLCNAGFNQCSIGNNTWCCAVGTACGSSMNQCV